VKPSPDDGVPRPARRGRLRWFWLVALLGAVLVVFSRAPSETTLVLELGTPTDHLTEVELTCEDSDGLSSGGRWTFRGATRSSSVSHELLTKGAQLRCEITLRSPDDVGHCTRTVELKSSEVRLRLEAEVRKLR
jgi:hypothetical protein